MAEAGPGPRMILALDMRDLMRICSLLCIPFAIAFAALITWRDR